MNLTLSKMLIVIFITIQSLGCSGQNDTSKTYNNGIEIDSAFYYIKYPNYNGRIYEFILFYGDSIVVFEATGDEVDIDILNLEPTHNPKSLLFEILSSSNLDSADWCMYMDSYKLNSDSTFTVLDSANSLSVNYKIIRKGNKKKYLLEMKILTSSDQNTNIKTAETFRKLYTRSVELKRIKRKLLPRLICHDPNHKNW